MNIRKTKTNNLFSSVLVAVVFAAMAFYCWPLPSGATAEQPTITDTTTKHVLDNGMTVLLNEMPASSMVAVYVLVKTGSATEGEYLGSGISHFVEHMLFKGTHSREVGAVGAEVKALGGSINASTSFDYTIYVLDLPKEHVKKGVDLIVDMVMNASFPEEEVESEREVIFGEMRLHNDNPGRVLGQLVQRTAYIRHSYQHPVIGYKDLFAKISQEDLIKYYQTHYIPNNMVMTVAGNFDSEVVLKEIKAKIKDFSRSHYLMRDLPQEPEQISPRYFEDSFPTDLTRFEMAYQSVSVLDKDLYALDVLSMLLGRGRTSRLFNEIYEKQQLVHSIHVSNYTPMDRGLFEIECTLDKENVEKAVAAIKSEIELVKKEGARKGELEKLKKMAVSSYVFGRQTAGQVASSLAINEAFAGDYTFSSKYVEGIGSVTNEDIKRVARKYLRDDNLSLVVLYPKKDFSDAKEHDEDIEIDDIEKVVLDNGAVVLLRVNRSVPIVVLKAVLHAGLDQEPESLSGLSELTSRLWARETKKRSPEKLAREIESKAASISPVSGYSYFGLSAGMLAADFEEIYEIFMDVFQNPVFSSEEFKKEKKQMQADILQRDDHIFNQVSQALRRRLFKTHPLRRESLGTKESVELISQDDVRRYYQDHFAANNLVISVFGDFERDSILERIAATIGKLPKKSVLINVHSESPPSSSIEDTIYVEKEQAMVLFGFHGPSIKNDDVHAVSVLNSVLGSSLSGRMFIKIRDELGQAYTLGAGARPVLDLGMIYMYVLTDEKDAEQVKETVKTIIQDIRTDLITDEELESTKNYLKGRYERALETNSALAGTAALNELYGMGYDFYKKYPLKIDAVTKEDVLRVAREYFDLQKSVVITAFPKNKTPNEE